MHYGYSDKTCEASTNGFYFLAVFLFLPSKISRQDGEELDPWNDGEALEHRWPEEYLISSHLFPSLTFHVFANI